jgi:N6-adenosine-specific RNA methylase IME4
VILKVTDDDWYEITETGLQVRGEFVRSQWEELGYELARNSKSLMWIVGDWLLAGESVGYLTRGKIDEACKVFGIESETARKAAQVCRLIESGMRIPLLSFTHHAVAANSNQAVELLEWAVENDATVKELRERKKEFSRTVESSVIEHGTTSSLESLFGSKFGTIYADPPWQYGNQATRASTDNHYETMTVDALCEMPVREIVSDDAHLHLWTTNAFLFEAKRVMDAWGFEYRSVFVWVKPQMGIGNYWRVSHEFMLLGIRGKAKSFKERNHMSWKSFNRGKHSAKPDEVRQVIEKVSPGPFLEMFGRKPVEGWTVFGNQIQG